MGSSPPVRTRFAPSPTGFLHLGSARTALFNWAFARRHRGQLVLRIEDTDRERSTAEFEAGLLEGLHWLGIEWDEGPLRQSQRAERYAAAIEDLLASERAYRCVCSREELEARKQSTIAAGGKWTYDGRCRDRQLGPDCGRHTVRLRLPRDRRFDWDDLVFGPSGQPASELGDIIIRRSDATPLYNLAVVVDDLDMQISHVIRGADHLSNTPVQLAIYDALGRRPPLLAHVPLIVAPGGKKLSKRLMPVSIQQYRDDGTLPQAMRNWLVRIGWSHGDEEIFSAEEICSFFDLRAVNRSSAQADPARLLWLNRHYIQTLPMPELLKQVLPAFEAELDREVEATPDLERLVDLLRERSKTPLDMARQARFFLVEKLSPYDPELAAKHLSPAIEASLAELCTQLEALEDWGEAGLETAFDAVRAQHAGLAMGKLAQAVRVAITGSAASPGIYETLAVLGKLRSLERIAAALSGVRDAAAKPA